MQPKPKPAHKFPRMPTPALQKKLDSLVAALGQWDSAVLAYSGGADSSLLAYVASKAIPDFLCVFEDSPATTADELPQAKKFCAKRRIKLHVVRGTELEDERFAVNDRNRCYFCKKSLFGKLGNIQKARTAQVVFDGSNSDDISDYRPGRVAAMEAGVRSPMMECGLTKSDVRAISKALGLPTWDRPQMACLSSRVPYGTRITAGLLQRIAQAEKIIGSLGHRTHRARAHGDILRIEIAPDEKIEIERLRKAAPLLKRQGFKYIVLDVEGYRTGSMNE